MKKVYVKIPGFETYYLVGYSLRRSRRGNMIAHPETVTPVSKYAYYKAPRSSRIVWFAVQEEIHELGNAALLETIKAQPDCDREEA